MSAVSAMSESHRTSDLVTELRAACKSGKGNYGHRLLCGQAADCIEQLQMPHAEVLRLAGKEDGVDTLSMINALCRKIEAQKREIERLHAKADRLTGLAMERGERS